ncbi:MAG: peptide deformylase [Caldisericia bacterium]
MIITDKLVLNKPSAIVLQEERDDIFKKLESELAMYDTAVGLAAVQIGIHKRAFVMKLLNGKILKVCNPVILESGCIRKDCNPKKMTKDMSILVAEGCLSFPGKSFLVKRATYVLVKDDIGGTYALEGKEAQVFQHEYDHLQGITLLDIGYKTSSIGRNDPCKCGSGKKYKKCCLK